MANGPRTHTKKTAAVRAAEQAYCYEESLKGFTVRQIEERSEAGFGKRLSRSLVHRLIQIECDERVRPLAEQIRRRELDKLDAIERRLNQEIDAFDIGHAPMEVARLTAVKLRTQERRAQFEGLDLPTRIENDTTIRFDFGSAADDL